LRLGGQWDRLVEVEPSDEAAYRELMRAELAKGSGAAGARGRRRQLDKDQLIDAAELGGTAPLWQWIGDDGATSFSY
jgi:DNA-binding SARP family transcriptional activator